MSRPASLRTTFAVVLAAIAVLSSTGTIALVVLSQRSRQASEELGGCVERQLVVEDVQRDVLLLDRARNPALRENLGRDAVARLQRVVELAPTPEERAPAESALATLVAHVADRTRPDVDPASFREDVVAEGALAALEQLERNRLSQARARADELARTANVVGAATGFVVVLGTLLLIAMVRRRVVRPLLGVSTRMAAFGRGDLSVRVEERGPLELQEMARAFNVMVDRLATQEQAHRTYLAAVAHDLRNPIQTLRLAVASQASAASDRVLTIVGRQLDRLDRLVGDLLDTASLRAGRLELALGEHDLRDVARNVANLFAGTSPQHTLVVDLPNEPVTVKCDATRIEQVVTNLVTNAIKYSPEGGTVKLSVASADDTATICVRDEGVGMTPDQVEAAFAPFSRGDELRKSVKGHGLGLFVARRLVDEHGGTIDVESTPGHGSCFTVRLRCDAT